MPRAPKCNNRSHDHTEMKGICYNFLKGDCRRGDECNFTHVTKAEINSRPRGCPLPDGYDENWRPKERAHAARTGGDTEDGKLLWRRPDAAPGRRPTTHRIHASIE